MGQKLGQRHNEMCMRKLRSFHIEMSERHVHLRVTRWDMLRSTEVLERTQKGRPTTIQMPMVVWPHLDDARQSCAEESIEV